MIDLKDAIAFIEHYTGKQKRRSYIFACRYEGCNNSIRIERSAFKKCSGFCRKHARANRGRPYGQSFNAIKNRARRKRLSFDLTYNQFEFLVQISCCHYCGESNIEWKTFNDGTRSNLDRKDNKLGYTFSNVVVCCTECNLMKRDWLSYEEFKAVRLFLKHWRSGSTEDREELMYDLVSRNMKVWQP